MKDFADIHANPPKMQFYFRLCSYRKRLQSTVHLLQGDSDTPVWIPVSMMATSETTATTSSNSSDALFESRWMEIFPVWEEQHRVAAGSEAMCREATEDPDDACSRPIASPPVIIDNGTVPWIMKGDPGMFLSSISHEDDGQVCNLPPPPAKREAFPFGTLPRGSGDCLLLHG